MRTFLMIVCLLLAASPLLAQQSASSIPAGPKTLADALAQVNWDAAQRGVLLAVNPQDVNAPKPPSMDDLAASAASAVAQPPLPIPELASRGYDARALADYFARQIVREGSVTILAPQTMTVLNAHPDPPNLYAGLRRSEAMTLLEGTLTPEQWKQIGSKEGLGVDEMTEDQRRLFLSMLPKPFVVDQTTTVYVYRKKDPAKTFRLTDAQRAQVRLRIVLETGARAELLNPKNSDFPNFPGIPQQTTHTVLFDANRNNGPKEFLSLVGNDEYDPHPDKFGQRLSAEVPNHLKKSQLNLDASMFAQPISLEPVNGKLTVADLIQRVDMATHEELYADPRIGHLSVWTRGLSARGSDVLKALCLGCTSTFRQVGPAYLLTDDIVGVGTRRALIEDWKNDANAQLTNLEQIAGKHLRDFHLEQYLTWADDEPLKLSPELFKQVTTYTAKSKNQDVALTALTPEQQQFIKDAAAKLAQQENGKYAVNPDHLTLDVGMWQSFVIPGLGEVVLTPDGGIYNTDPAEDKAEEAVSVTLPPNRALYIAPADPKEARQTVLEAQKRGYTALWLQIPADGNLTSLIAAIQAARKISLPVYAVMRLMNRPAGTPDSAINILGEPLSTYLDSRPPSYFEGDPLPKDQSWDWARLDNPNLFSSLQTRLLTLVKTPGLAGLVLSDIAAPGFDLPSSEEFGGYTRGQAAEGDYAPDIRLAFLRRYGADPIDIVPYESYDDYDNNTGLSLFPDDADLAKDWRGFRYTANLALLTRLYASVRRVSPSLPLLVQARGGFWAANWFGSWDNPNGVPYAPGGWSPGQNFANTARSRSKLILFDYRATTPDGHGADYVTRLRNGLNAAGKGWDGLVLDFSALPLTKALSLLDSLPVPNPSPLSPDGKTP